MSKILTGILVLILGITAGLMIEKTSLLSRIPFLTATPTPTPIAIPTPTPNPTADWKTYTNTQYGFSLKYPKNAEYKITNYANADFSVTFSKLTEFPYEDMTVFVGKNWAFTDPNADTTKNYTLAELQAYRKDVPMGQNPPQSFVFVKHEVNYFTIQQNKDPKDLAIDQTFNQILSTFKFIDATTNSGWKTYSNGSISFQYPSGWSVQERVPGFFVIVNPSDAHITTAGISIDTRYTESYDTVVQNHKANLVNIQEFPISNGIKITGTVSDAVPGGGVQIIDVVLKHGSSAIAIETSPQGSDTKDFDQIVSTFTFTQ